MRRKDFGAAALGIGFLCAAVNSRGRRRPGRQLSVKATVLCPSSTPSLLRNTVGEEVSFVIFCTYKRSIIWAFQLLEHAFLFFLSIFFLSKLPNRLSAQTISSRASLTVNILRQKCFFCPKWTKWGLAEVLGGKNQFLFERVQMVPKGSLMAKNT